MGCFTFGFLVQVLVAAIVICAVVAIVQVLLPRVMGALGEFSGTVIAILRIVIWAIVLIALIYFVYDLFLCLYYAGGRPLIR